MTATTISTNGTHHQTAQPAPAPSTGFELEAVTEPGKRLVALAESLAAEFAASAAEHDRQGTYNFEAIETLRQHGYFVAPIPEELGGLVVESVHDLLVASSRLARGEPSITIGVNMHLITVISLVRRWRAARAAGNERREAAFAGSLRMIAQSGAVIAAAVSEPSQHLTRPSTTAVRTETGWVINGRKIFCTMSPAATTLLVAVRFEDEQGAEMYGYAMVPASTPGIIFHDDWDSLGMRGSGSQSVSFEDVGIPEALLRGGFPVGSAADFMERNLSSGTFHASASLGIAEAAHAQVLASISARRTGSGSERPHNIELAAQNAIDISAMRSILGREGRLIDGLYAAHPLIDETPAEMSEVFAEVQAAKAFINEASVRVVDRALTLSGGGGYMNKNPLSRAYRDVRAGAFMHPLGANRAYEFIGQVTLGLEPDLS